MYFYKIKKETLHHPQIGIYTAFGIEVYEKQTLRMLMEISDVFTNIDKAREFAFLCNKHQPEPIHLEELCIDFIQ